MVDSQQRRKLVAIAAVLVTTVISGHFHTISAADEIDDKAAAILDKYVEATGGKAAYENIKNRVSKLTMEMAAQGVKMDMAVYAAKPNKTYILLESDAVGKIEQGCDGTVAWANSTMTGPQIMEGAQKVTLMRDGILDRFAFWRTVYVGAKYEGTEEFDGKSCHKIVLTPKKIEGAPEDEKQTVLVDANTNLIVRIDTKVQSPMGVVPVSAVLSDYRAVDGVKISFKTTMKVMGAERIITINDVKNNVDLPADRFDLPPEVKALLK